MPTDDPTRSLALALALLAACSGGGTDPDATLEGGVLATFSVEGETFNLWSTNATTIGDLLALRNGTSDARIPNGPLLPGPGAGDHNAPWSWHLDPEPTTMAESTIEVCSGRPSHVEEELDAWLSLGQYCPWAAVLTGLEDRR
ncbi:MAG TPA: hypothetical protein VE173_14315 [Longimicrobiales bacterium]|nr:hypothetical protein [Longimicrobiales bacterium]